MKLFIATILVFASTISFAKARKFDAVGQISSSSIEMTSLCPENARCITDGTSIILEYFVKCTEKLVSFNYEAVEMENDRTVVVVNAVVGKFNTLVIDGPQAICLGMERVTKRIDLVMNFDEIEVRELTN